MLADWACVTFAGRHARGRLPNSISPGSGGSTASSRMGAFGEPPIRVGCPLENAPAVRGKAARWAGTAAYGEAPGPPYHLASPVRGNFRKGAWGPDFWRRGTRKVLPLTRAYTRGACLPPRAKPATYPSHGRLSAE